MEDKTSIRAKPFVKWIGGKKSLLEDIFANLPKNFNNYFEPFVGGGAVFFALSDRIRKATISDINLELMIAYRIIQKDPESLINLLKIHQRNHSSRYYYQLRGKEPQDPAAVAARFIYLNKTCYNGLYRVNRQGKFNAAMGRYKHPNIIQEDNIMACHKALKKVTIVHGDFENIKPGKGDFVYFDPPYQQINETSFNKYTQSLFTQEDQERLRNYIDKLSKNGVYIMLSNSRTEFIKYLYKSKKYRKSIVSAPRLVNCNADLRGDVEEFIITNY